jgi:predicted dehydrogenase
MNRKTAEFWKVKRFYDSFEEFLENERGNIDAVSVLLPTPDHFEVVKKLLENNIPVICEKPLFSSLDDLIRLESELNVDNRFLVITYNYIAYPILYELRKMILDGVFGDIINVHLEMPQESFLRPPKSIDYPPAWRKKDGFIPGVLLDLASHLLSLSKYLVGKRIKSVYSVFKSFSPYKVVDEVKAILNYEDETTGFLWVSKVALGNRNGLKVSIYGTKASAIWIQEDPEKLYVNYSDGRKCILDRGTNLDVSKIRIYNRMTPGHPAGFVEAFANLYYEIANALKRYLRGEPYDVSPLIWTFEKEKESFRVLDAIVKSSRSNSKVEVEK